ncbi:DUF1992 domain-containing protein [Microtetraspora sp. AC03309]|uniref:DnaJ family domain-containing protein n=1 Tax=Microtetraspora sp. AC03309 TaxID=2779376 RepID=UPI001E3EE209|nr:DUF1992 domain-containing protein [Microtetraspora sp. AC03309]MCC5581528.1 DUF1992 domain-containing protein [Microtetraspora sp. AC03309]
MTERKPPGVSFESWIDRQIREGTERGLFDNLPGTGKPLPDQGKPYDEMWWIKQKLREENLTLPLPGTLALRKEAEEARAAAAGARSEAEVRKIIADINEKIVEGTRKAMSGPPLNLAPLDVDEVVRDWRERQPARTPPVAAPPERRPKERSLFGWLRGNR